MAIEDSVRQFVLEEYLPGEDPAELKDDTPLRTSGILDSIATLRLVEFLEERFEITIEPQDLDGDSLESVSRIAGLVRSKQSAG